MTELHEHSPKLPSVLPGDFYIFKSLLWHGISVQADTYTPIIYRTL